MAAEGAHGHAAHAPVIDDRWQVCVLDAAPGGRRVLGAGMLVGGGQVLTCAHVVAAGTGGAGPGARVLIELVHAPDLPTIPASVAPGGWFPAQADGRGDLALLDLDRPVEPPVPPAPLRRLAPTPHRRVLAFGFPRGFEDVGQIAFGELAGWSRGRARVQIDARVASRPFARGYSGAGVVTDDARREVIGMVVTTYVGADVAWMLPIEAVAGYLPGLAGCIRGDPAVDASLAAPPAAAPGEPRPDVARQFVIWSSRRGWRRVRLLVTGAEGSDERRELSRVITLADWELSARASDGPAPGSSPGTVPQEGSVQLALDASGRSADDIRWRVADRLGVAVDELTSRHRATGAGAAHDLRVVVVGVDRAAEPEAVLREVLGPLADHGCRMLVTFGDRSSPAWAWARDRWPLAELPDDDPVVLARQLDRLGLGLASLKRDHRQLSRHRRRAAAVVAGLPALANVPSPLARRLGELAGADVASAGSWLAAQIDGLEHDVDRAHHQLARHRMAVDALVDRRVELRGRLEAFHAWAIDLGLVEDLELDALYRRARQVLHHRPCDLEATDRCVREYEEEVRARGWRP